MNTSTSSFSLFSCVLVVLLSAFIIITTSTATKTSIVIDTDGDPVRNGGIYRLSVVSPDRENEVTRAAIRNSPESQECVMGVIEEESKNGMAVSIRQVSGRGVFLDTRIAVTVFFANVPPNVCTNSSKWTVFRKPLVDGKYMPVMVNDFGSGGAFYLKVHDYEKKEYKLYFPGGGIMKGNIGVQVDKDNNNLKRLVVKNHGDPLVFKFRKAHDDDDDHDDKESLNKSRSVLSMVV